MHRQPHDGDRGDDKTDVRGSVIVHGSHTAINVLVRGIFEDSAQHEKEYEGESEGEDHSDGLTHEELKLYQGKFQQHTHHLISVPVPVARNGQKYILQRGLLHAEVGRRNAVGNK